MSRNPVWQIGFVFTDRAPLDPVHAETSKSKCRTALGVTASPSTNPLSLNQPPTLSTASLAIFSDQPTKCFTSISKNVEGFRSLSTLSLLLQLLLLHPLLHTLPVRPRHTYPNCQIIMTSSFRRTFAHLFRSFSLVFHLFFRFNQNYCKWRVLAPIPYHPISSSSHLLRSASSSNYQSVVNVKRF